ncbi:methyl-accepting chemotaxis protein [Oxalobacteraceae bacterium A2-2]
MQLALAFGALVLTIICIALLSIRDLAQESERFENYVNGVNARAAATHMLREAVDQRAISARNLVLVTTPGDLELERKTVLAAQDAAVRHLARLKELAQQPDVSARGRELVDAIDKVEQQYAKVALAIVDLALRGEKEQAIRRMNEDCRPLLRQLIAATDAYSEHAAQRSAVLVGEAHAAYLTARHVLAGASVFAIGLSVLAGMWITRTLWRSLGAEPRDLAEAVGRVADNDLTVRLQVHPKDERSVLAAVQRMQVSLTGVVLAVRNDARQVETAASEISIGNNELSERTERQAGALQETASSMDELTSTVRQNADNARQASELAAAASSVAGKGGAVVGEVVATMDSISEASRRIVDIISVIDGIAFQTNILALNAAVEAARAGEQGRGFAVVASEVRTLAQRSATAAKEIKELIDNSVQRVEAGARLAGDAGATMRDVVDSVQRVSDIVTAISAASQQQYGGIEHVNQSVSAMDDVTQQNASLVEEAAAAAESLREQAAHLVQAVGIFRVAADGGASMEHRAAPGRQHGGGALPRLGLSA